MARNGASAASGDTHDTPGTRMTNWLPAIAAWLAGGIVVLFCLGAGNDTIGPVAAIMSSILLAGAAAVVGGFLGFLFGIPRAKQIPAAPTPEDGKAAREYLENTNLEQISDWLTKIIVGITLVEFGAIRDLMVSVGRSIGPALIDADVGLQTGVGVAILVYFLILGFLFSYLWTRIYMEYVLRKQNALSSREFEDLLDERQDREGAADAEALELVNAYLESDADPNAPHFSDLTEKVTESSAIARSLIFDKARETRSAAWRHPEKRFMVARTVPIFQGLVAASPDRNHRNYGQLGYALIKSEQPKWKEAQTALERAIRLRGPGPNSGQGYYEYNLALALINQDAQFKAGKPSDPDLSKRIAGLLDSGRTVIPLREEPDIPAWAKLNGYKI